MNDINSFKKTNHIKKITEIALFVSVITICSWISIPLIIPITLQTLIIFLVIHISDFKTSMISVIIYIILGLIGVPVFSFFKSGLASILGPTGGFIIGFIPLTFFSSLLTEKHKGNKIFCLLVYLFGLLLLYTIGSLWYYFVYSKDSISSILLICVIPFIIPDIIKIVLAIYIGSTFIKMIKKRSL